MNAQLMGLGAAIGGRVACLVGVTSMFPPLRPRTKSKKNYDIEKEENKHEKGARLNEIIVFNIFAVLFFQLIAYFTNILLW